MQENPIDALLKKHLTTLNLLRTATVHLWMQDEGRVSIIAELFRDGGLRPEEQRMISEVMERNPASRKWPLAIANIDSQIEQIERMLTA